MRELTQDPFYKLIDREYDKCVIEYCLIAPDFPYRGMRSHREAVLFAMLKMIERYLEDQRASEEKYAEEVKVKDDFFPWSIDFGKAKAHQIDPEEFLFTPTVMRKIKGGSVIYDRRDPDVDAGEQIPYWYAFLEPPQWFDCTPDDFRRRHSYVAFTEADLRATKPTIEAFAAVEGLDGHGRAATIRFNA